MGLSVKIETPQQDAVESLLRLSDAVAAHLYPGEYRRPLNPATLAAPDILVFVARAAEGSAAGCCAVFDIGDGSVELKRMIVDPRFQKQGVGKALLQAAEESARSKGVQRILMEVGTRNTGGQSLYRNAGYTERGPFGAYRPSPISLFFEKVLSKQP
jgi:putative acetyltransferase